MAIFRGVGSVGDIADNSLLEEITAQAEAAEASATAAANSATSALNTELTSASFSTSDGVLTLTKQDNETVTTDLDGRFLPLAGGTLTGAVNCLSSINLGNNVNLNIGNGNVFQLYHNGSTSVIKESGNGNLAILGDNVYLSNPDGTETYLLAQEGLGVNLYYDNQLKFATNNNGVDVTGTLEFDGLRGTGSVTVTDILDEDNMASDSATALATQQSIKAYVDANAGGSSQWTASGSDIYYNTGKVGIGTTSPVRHLDVRGGTTDIVANFESSDTGGYISLQDNTTSSDTAVLVGAIGDELRIDTGDTESVRIDSSGNVGIGTSNPDRALHVSTSDNLPVFVESTDGLSLLGIGDSSGTVAVAANGSSFSVYTGGEVGGNTSFGTERMRIDASGDVLIGGTQKQSPSGIDKGLFIQSQTNGDVVGVNLYSNELNNNRRADFFLDDTNGIYGVQSTASTGLPDFVIKSGSNERFRVTNAGNVGIGTSSPNRPLTVESSDVGLAEFESTNSTSKVYFKDSGTTNTYSVAVGSVGDEMAFYASSGGAERMRIDSSGKVGIGTSSPAYTLDVNSGNPNNENIARFSSSGGVRAIINTDSDDDGAFSLYDKADATKVFLRSVGDSYFNGGNVGIGTDGPVAPLQVNGTIYAEGGTFDAPDDGNPPSGSDNIDNIAFVMPRDNKIAFWHDGYVRTLLHQDPQGVTQIGQTGTNYITGIKLNCGQGGDVTIQNTDGDAGLTVEGALTAGGNAYPTTQGTNGQVLVTNGSGTLSFADQSGGISNVVEDTTPQLGGDLDAQDNEINNVDKLGINTSSPSVACDVQFVKTGDLVAGLRVHTSAATSYDGKVITWGEQTAERGVLGWADGYGVTSCYIASGTAGLRFQTEFGSSPRVIPCRSTGDKNDNAIDLGMYNARFDDIYATNTSIISSSDSTLKQDIEELTDAEERVAVACKGLLRKFRWRDAVEEKGDEARIHFGIMAQDLRDAFTAEGLDAGRYGMFISNTWWEHEGETYPTSDSAPEGATEVTRLGVRYTELLAFIISAI